MSHQDAPNPPVTTCTVLVMLTIRQWQLWGWDELQPKFFIAHNLKTHQLLHNFQTYYVLFILDSHKAVEPILLGTLPFVRDLPYEQGILAGCHGV